MPSQIRINITRQTLIYSCNKLEEPIQFSISTGSNGVGQKEGSGQTPLGKHIIRAKVGQGMPAGAVFVGRRFTGEIYSHDLAVKFPDRDWILSRILWLSGKEVGVNRLGDVDTMRRYIYIHGTPDTEPMGIPASHGCIRMRNQDIIQLFDLVDLYTPVVIEP
ncbi:L,D-transpeptidase [Hahella ganghwensis]|uniref:L,D-transpeptidase n=1 Tax=Hahella ganghwensis TaxID=286420 RepID=UPI000379220B|nr:L,D-transpeptidase [Hahella ganghwensis]